MNTKRPTYKKLMADIKAGKVTDVEVVGPYAYAKLSKGSDESVAIERQAN
jgi:hypothetical protein